DGPDGPTHQSFDRVVLAIPFVVLRNIDYASAGFDERKHTAIQQLGYGYHTKLHVQFDDRPWRVGTAWPTPTTGQIWTDLRFQCSTDATLGQAGSSGILERFTGSSPALVDAPATPYAKLDDDPAVGRNLRAFFAELDPIWPEVSKYFNGKATMSNVQADPNTLASYSCWLVGQYTTIAGYERVRQGRVHFAGEHCSVENQGFMEGGAETGIAAAKEVLADYHLRVFPQA
ncbi:MAG TPA: FAD-dependent oxidoreductase, partial [Candidatus Baltobacteraceae bacterium]|nr:FAD-dependent oxidoreductase [Candidatus Baltobacteraceae bacterium]